MQRVCCNVVVAAEQEVAAAILANPLIDRFIIRNQQLRRINNLVAVVVTFSTVIPDGTFTSRRGNHVPLSFFATPPLRCLFLFTSFCAVLII